MPLTPAASGVAPEIVPLDARTGDGPHLHAPHVHAANVHGPRAGETASLLVDYRELFKVRVTGMVVLTGWAGFYLGSIRSGISSLQPGLLETLLGIGAVSAGSAALNQAIERRMASRLACWPSSPGRCG